MKHYRITLSGHGGEFVFSKSSLEEFMYWNSEEPLELVEDGADPLTTYILDKECEEEADKFDAVKFKREGEWFEQDDIDHTCGVNLDYAYISIDEVDGTGYDCNVVQNLYDYVSLGEFIADNDIQLTYEEAEYGDCSHVLACVSIEKGIFFEGFVSTDKPFDIKKLKFHTKEYITEDELVETVFYNGEQLDSESIDTVGKGMDVRIHSVLL